MPTIESVSVCIARVPLAHPVTFSTRQVKAREYCLVRIRSTDGQEGLGYCYAVNSAGRLLAVAVTDLLAPRLVGQESLRVEGLWSELYQEALLLGRAGGVMRALSAIDIALWDLNARSAGLPLHQYLGATVADRVPAYASKKTLKKKKQIPNTHQKKTK
jgi:L-alanine-DL-glutamate epimerase-like enolase superfamily enzyme